jgi:hypothetical protein
MCRSRRAISSGGLYPAGKIPSIPEIGGNDDPIRYDGARSMALA